MAINETRVNNIRLSRRLWIGAVEDPERRDEGHVMSI